ncbi:hypothetical protein TNCV_1173501 [Trichonephila clavipes]|uniref:Uncharacterized protein n=1 Tax=Trichonephila clavipes TaxID=2585209 RepID=A0A8X6RWY4_TRICX|nr:hypothetical protein TNCV_1173501 [Trichonephila clavipes]
MISVAGPVWRCITQQFSSLSPRCHQTRIRPSGCCRQKRDSAFNTMSFHSVVYVYRSSLLWWGKCLWFPDKGKRSNGRLADIPLCCKKRRIVLADTE